MIISLVQYDAKILKSNNKIHAAQIFSSLCKTRKIFSAVVMPDQLSVE